MPHLLVDISAHGYGHVSQTAPVVNALAQLVPALRVTLRTAAPRALLQQRFRCAFTHIPVAFDFGMSMASAVDVQVAESAAAYREFHSAWELQVQREAQALRALSPDLLLANIPYLSLAAAHAAQVRAVGMCSLNWADIYRHYCAGEHYTPQVHAQMSAAYNSAACFLQPQPSMPMPEFSNTRPVGPIARIGNNRRAEIVQRLSGFSPQDKLVLVVMGGMEFRLPMENWPRTPGVHWLVPAAWNIARADISAFDALDLPFSDVLASSDAVLTKPGYGTFAEAACAGIPLLSVIRRDWPEEPYLVQWLKRNGRCLEVERATLETGDIQGLLQQLWAMPRPPTPHPTGADEAAACLRDLLLG